MRIVILNVAIEDVKTAKGGYQKADVAFKDEQGKTQGKKLVSFTNPSVFDTLKVSKAGDAFDIKQERDEKNYWQWVGITPVNDSAPAATTEPPKATFTSTNISPKSTYETAEERALRRAFEEKKQTLIIRQSSIANAIEFYSVSGKKPTFEEVLQTATKFESFINRPVMGNALEMANDTDGIV